MAGSVHRLARRLGKGRLNDPRHSSLQPIAIAPGPFAETYAPGRKIAPLPRKCA
jgi:hypothetical protein